jgi:hypothetical protein
MVKKTIHREIYTLIFNKYSDTIPLLLKNNASCYMPSKKNK